MKVSEKDGGWRERKSEWNPVKAIQEISPSLYCKCRRVDVGGCLHSYYPLYRKFRDHYCGDGWMITSSRLEQPHINTHSGRMVLKIANTCREIVAKFKSTSCSAWEENKSDIHICSN